MQMLLLTWDNIDRIYSGTTAASMIAVVMMMTLMMSTRIVMMTQVSSLGMSKTSVGGYICIVTR
jgi:hypothetical protein